MTLPSASELERLLEEAVALATAAGSSTLEWFGRADLDVEHKSDGTPVTVADRRAEQLIRDELAIRHPRDGIIGEEHGDVASESGRSWVIDPIDGTKAFARGVPLYSTLVAVLVEERPVVGVIHLPALNETIAAAHGLGCRRNGEPCSVSSRASLDQAWIMTSGVGHWRQGRLQRLIDAGSHVRTWGDAYGYALVASGRADAMVDPEAALWDLAPMPVIMAEAGGVFSAVDGVDSAAAGSGVGSNGLFHASLLHALS